MNNNGDIVITNKGGRLIAVIEIKNMRDLTANDIRNYRKNMITHGLLPLDTPYFLLLSQEKCYLWDNRIQHEEESDPLFEFSMANVIKKYRPEKLPEKWLSENVLELIVLRWLIPLTEIDGITLEEEPDKSLQQMGFIHSIEKSQIDFGENDDSIY